MMIILTREGKTFKTAHYWKQYGENGKKHRISYKTACELEEIALAERRIDHYKSLCGNYLTQAWIKEEEM